MITQQILKYKDRSFWPGVKYYGGSHDRPSYRPREMSKLEYANFLKTLEFKVGDFVTSQYGTPGPWGVYRVVYIEEIHSQVKIWPTTDSGTPECVTLEQFDESRKPWIIMPGNFKKYTGELPPEWKQRIVRDILKQTEAAC